MLFIRPDRRERKDIVAKNSESSPPTPAFLSRQVESSRVFFFEEAERSPFEVRCGGLERCSSDYRINRESFPWFLLEFVHGGRGSVELDGAESVLKPGVFFLYGPGMPHRIASDSEKPLVKYFTGFSGSAAASFLEQHDLRPGMVSQCLKGEPIRRAFDTLIDRGLRNSKYSQPLCAVIVQQLLLMCREDAVDARSTDTKAFATFSRVKEHIEARFLEFGSLDAVASACELDAPYLCRLFSRFHDESPYQFLTRLKMQHAASLLLESEVSVKEAAATTGFPDPFHFSRVFKSIHRVPPSRFREAMHAKQPR